ncbi:helix-turn-helix transcriptional regulator [Rubellimicrobium arenae]|uniref:helix-turn-helix transcriptional regulator n=1 Tax=Rubellimicrobium arenae TaxID=2817372 RepID=UPI001B315275|nr:helix-turn-helix transcriptional regulator [Rubellimicrobium arenae]
MNISIPRPTRTIVLAGLIAVQVLCAAFFLWDAADDYAEGAADAEGLHLEVETLATLSLILAIGLEAGLLVRLIRREAHMIRGLSAAARALHEIIDEYFAVWKLTPAEQDVATFLIKGADIAEIARLRGSAEGTVKAHLNAIYRKAGVSGRPALISLLIEDLMTEPLLKREAGGRSG